MRTYFYIPDENLVLEPAREVLPGLWIGRQSGTPLEQLLHKHPSLILVDQHKLQSMAAATERLQGARRRLAGTSG